MKNIFTLISFGLLYCCTANSNPQSSPPPSSSFAQLRSNLYIVTPTGSTVLMDGTLTQYDSSYSNAMDGMDARKMSNFSENWGMLRGNTTYVIERRHSIVDSDSIFFKMWNMRIITYRIEIITANLDQPERTGILEDAYLKKSTPFQLNGTTFIDFSVTADPASKASDRFRIILNTPPPVPVTFTSARAFQLRNSVSIDWKTANEKYVKQYDIERSFEGGRFEKTSEVKVSPSTFSNYSWTDVNPLRGNNYYRIRSIETNGKSHYSDTMKVFVGKGDLAFSVYPNPATAENLNLQFVNQPAGAYEVRLFNSSGNIFMARTIYHPGGSSLKNIRPEGNIPKGIYRVEIKTPAGNRQVISVAL